MRKPRKLVHSSFAKEFFICPSSAKLRYYESLHCIHYGSFRATTSRPGARGPAVERHRKISLSLHRWQPIFFPKSHQTSSKRSSQGPKSEALQEPNTKAPGVCCSFDAPSADGWVCGRQLGARNILQKFHKGLGKSQNAFSRGWPSKPCKNA